MDLLKKLPWWCWGLLLAVVLVSIAIAKGAAQAAGGALLALVGSGLIAHRANRRARSINDQLGDRLAVERHAVDALNEEQERDLANPTSPPSEPPSDPAEEATRRAAVEDPWE